MASPHDLFIRFLITRGVDNLVQLNSELNTLSLPRATSIEFNAQSSYIENMVPPGILAQISSTIYSIDFIKWMKEMQLESFWRAEAKWAVDYPDSVVARKLSIDIHNDRSLRLTINGLLLKGMPIFDILPLVNGKFSTVLKEIHLKLYKEFFFDPERMTRGDWRKYVELLEPEEKNIFFIGLTEDLEAVKTELDLSARVSTSDTIQFLLSKSIQKAKQSLKVNTIQGGKEARAWISQVTDLVDKYEKYKASDSNDFAKSLQLEFDFIETIFPTPDKKTLETLDAQKKKHETEKKMSAEGAAPENLGQGMDSESDDLFSDPAG